MGAREYEMRRLEEAVVVGAGARAIEDVTAVAVRLQAIAEGTPEHRRVADKLCRALMPMLQKLAMRFEGSRGTLEVEDLVQVGLIAMLRCVPSFNPSKKQTFDWWAFHHANRAIMDHVRLHSSDVRPSHGAQRGRVKNTDAVETTVWSRDARLGVVPKDGGQDAEFTGENRKQGHSMQAGGRDLPATPEAMLELAQDKALVRRLLNRLPRPMRDLVAAVHGVNQDQESSLRSIARDWNEPRAKLDAMLKRGEALLRKMLEREYRQRAVQEDGE